MHLNICKIMVVLVSSILSATCAKLFDNYKLLAINNLSDYQTIFIENLWTNNYDFPVIEVLEPPRADGSDVNILVSPEFYSNFTQILKYHDIKYKNIHEDIQRLINEEKPHIRQRRETNTRNFDLKFLSNFNDYVQIKDFLQALERENSDIVTLSSIGTTHENRSILMITISSGGSSGVDKPAVWLDAGIHAREWIAPAVAVYHIYKLVNGYKTDPKIKELVEKIDFHIVPVLNPDGYMYSHTSNRMWRKNRSPCPVPGRNCCVGTDLNRNFDWFWGTSGSSSKTCSNTYAGAEPFSEPEAVAARDFILNNKNKIKAYFSLHSKGQIWMYSFGYKKNTYPEDVDDLRHVAVRASAALRDVHGEYYNVGSAADTTYPAAGGSDDWSKGRANIKFVYLLELRPKGRSAAGFITKPRNIIPTGEETWAGMSVVFNEVTLRYSSQNNEVPKSTDDEEVDDHKISTNIQCRDKRRSCASIFIRGKCSTKKNMKLKCAKSCGYCKK